MLVLYLDQRKTYVYNNGKRAKLYAEMALKKLMKFQIPL